MLSYLAMLSNALPIPLPFRPGTRFSRSTEMIFLKVSVHSVVTARAANGPFGSGAPLFYSLEARGCTVAAVTGYTCRFKVLVNDEPMAISLSGAETSDPSFRRISSVRLIQTIEELMWKGYQRNWSDGSSVSVEEKIGSFVDALKSFRPLVREQRIAGEREKAIWEAEEQGRILYCKLTCSCTQPPLESEP